MQDEEAEAEVERRVADIKRSLEASYADKRRAAAVQDRRARERLEQDRKEWDAHKRAEKQRLSALAETLRRQEENASRRLQEREQELTRLQQARQETERQEASAREVQQESGERVAALEGRVARARGAMRLAAALGALGIALVLADAPRTVTLVVLLAGPLWILWRATRI